MILLKSFTRLRGFSTLFLHYSRCIYENLCNALARLHVKPPAKRRITTSECQLRENEKTLLEKNVSDFISIH